MPAPTNPRKRSLMEAGKLRKALRAAGHHLDPIVQIGKEGVTPAVLRQLDEALLAHELVKVKVGTESPEDRFETAGRIADESGARVAQVLGRTILAYRRHPRKPRFEPAPAPAERAERANPARRAPARRPPRSRAGPRPRAGPRTRARGTRTR